MSSEIARSTMSFASPPVQPGVIKIATDAAANDSEIENADSLNQLIGRALSVVLRRERPHERDHVAWINSAVHKKRRSGSVQTSNDPERDRDDRDLADFFLERKKCGRPQTFFDRYSARFGFDVSRDLIQLDRLHEPLSS